MLFRHVSVHKIMLPGAPPEMQAELDKRGLPWRPRTCSTSSLSPVREAVPIGTPVNATIAKSIGKPFLPPPMAAGGCQGRDAAPREASNSDPDKVIPGASPSTGTYLTVFTCSPACPGKPPSRSFSRNCATKTASFWNSLK